MATSRKPVIFTFLGIPGSGKTYFARNLAQKTATVRLSSDAMRLAIFGSLEGIAQAYNSDDREIVNTYTFGAIDYVVNELLSNGQDVVYDAHYNQRSKREELEKIAQKNNAQVILVRINTPYDIALQRGQNREAAPDQRKLDEHHMREVIERHRANTDEPLSSENVIDVSGEVPFDEQYKSFKESLKEYRSE